MILYKYMSAKRLVGLLEEKKMRLSRFMDQNDPFENSISLLPNDDEAKDAEYDDYDAERAAIFVRCQREYDQFGMICLTTEYRNILMWAHYADCHKGAVVAFDTTHPFFNSKENYSAESVYKGIEDGPINSPGFGTVRQMDYRSNRKLVKLGDPLSLYDLFFAKSDHWSYENEYRILKNVWGMEPSKILPSGEKIYLADFPVNCIKEVILGLRFDDEEIPKVIELVEKELKPDAKLLKANLAHLTYDMQIKEIDRSDYWI